MTLTPPPSPNWKNRTIFVADNIRILRGMNSESVDCIATDPPFNSKQIYFAPLGLRSAGQRFNDCWRWDEVTDEWQDVIASDHPKIKELIEAAAVIEGGSIDHKTGKVNTGRIKNSIAAYLAWMAPRIVEMHRVLKPSGVLFLHCDTHANSYLRLLLDAVFGRSKMINEIVRRRIDSKGLASKRLPNNHDTILVYGKTDKWKWNKAYEPYDLKNLDAKTLSQYNKTDRVGRYQLTDLTNPNKDRPNLTYEFLGITKVWRWTMERMQQAYDDGRVVQTRPGNVPRFKRYLHEQPGKPRDTIWLDVVQPNKSDDHWETRKPVSLYTRLIACATEPDDIVLDPFCGCGTTLVAAQKLGCRWVGIDIDLVAESVTKKRLFDECGLTGEEPVIVRKTLRRKDIPHIKDDKLRQALYAKQGRKCGNPYCDSKSLRAVDLHLDHRIPKVRGGEDDVLNRIGLCADCNSRKGKKAWGQFLDEERSEKPHPTVGE